MKVILTILTLSLAFTSFASETKNIEEHKKMTVSELEKRISLLQDEKNCISSASSADDIKKCRESSKAAHEKMHAEHKQMQTKMLDERIQKLQEEKAKLNEKK